MNDPDLNTDPIVGVIMGSDSDLPVMQAAVDVLDQFGVKREVRIISAHRTPEDMLNYAGTAAARGLKVIVAGAGGAAHLPGMIASVTILPVIGVPVGITRLQGLDALLSIAQMPAGVPVATVAIDNSRNAGLLAVRILAVADERLKLALDSLREETAHAVREKDAVTRQRFSPKQQSD